ncbi:MAG: hypothetical protein QJR08_03695 [Bacillota bacterium]|nr:hypothetical protein [Bacillota bacterium]
MEGLSAVAARDLARYYELLGRGLDRAAEVVRPADVTALARAIEERGSLTLLDLDPGLAERLRLLDPAALAAVIDAAEREVLAVREGRPIV